jgi:hypothetical protein
MREERRMKNFSSFFSLFFRQRALSTVTSIPFFFEVQSSLFLMMLARLFVRKTGRKGDREFGERGKYFFVLFCFLQFHSPELRKLWIINSRFSLARLSLSASTAGGKGGIAERGMPRRSASRASAK